MLCNVCLAAASSLDEVQSAISHGQAIVSYPDDKPYPSYLILHFTAGQPLHVVVAQDTGTDTCVVVTAYRPDPLLWNSSFTRKLN